MNILNFLNPLKFLDLIEEDFYPQQPETPIEPGDRKSDDHKKEAVVLSKDLPKVIDITKVLPRQLFPYIFGFVSERDFKVARECCQQFRVIPARLLFLKTEKLNLVPLRSYCRRAAEEPVISKGEKLPDNYFEEIQKAASRYRELDLIPLRTDINADSPDYQPLDMKELFKIFTGQEDLFPHVTHLRLSIPTQTERGGGRRRGAVARTTTHYDDEAFLRLIKYIQICCPKLTALTLGGSLQFANTCQILQTFPKLKHVTLLTSFIDASIVDCLNKLIELETVSLSFYTLHQDVHLLPRIRCLTALQTYVNRGDDLRSIASCSKLARLNLYGGNAGSDENCIQMLKSLPDLTDLMITNCRGLTGEVLTAIPSLTKLKKLSLCTWLAHVEVSKKTCLSWLVGPSITYLKRINADQLKMLQVCPKLEEISISNCNFLGNEEFQMLTLLPNLKRLTIHQGAEKISKESLRAIADCKNLEYLKISVFLKHSSERWEAADTSFEDFLEIVDQCSSLRELDLSCMHSNYFDKKVIELIEALRKKKPYLAIKINEKPHSFADTTSDSRNFIR